MPERPRRRLTDCVPSRMQAARFRVATGFIPIATTVAASPFSHSLLRCMTLHRHKPWENRTIFILARDGREKATAAEIAINREGLCSLVTSPSIGRANGWNARQRRNLRACFLPDVNRTARCRSTRRSADGKRSKDGPKRWRRLARTRGPERRAKNHKKMRHCNIVGAPSFRCLALSHLRWNYVGPAFSS